MRAEALATGDHIVFDGMPSLHTAAHDAAYMVQQRAGVSLYGGVGRHDDYERQTDRVADAVVRSESAEGLLGTPAAATGRSPDHAIQLTSTWSPVFHTSTALRAPRARSPCS